MSRSHTLAVGRRARALMGAVAVVLSVTLVGGPALAAVGPASDPAIPSDQDVKDAKRDAARAADTVENAQRELATSAAQLQQLGLTLATASENYNAAQYQLSQANAESDEARQALGKAEREQSDAEGELATFAAAAYRSGGDIARVSAMLSADGPQSLIDQASTMDVLGDRQAAVLSRVEAARAASSVQRDRAAAAVDQRELAVAEVSAARDAAQRAVSDQQAVANQLESRKKKLVERLQGLQGRSKALAEERATALAQQAAEEAEKAAKAARPPANADSSLNNGPDTSGIPRGILLGMPERVSEGRQLGDEAGAQKAIEFARKQIGKPYLWGGAGPERFDCSGLTMRAWQQGGVSMGHWTVVQYAAGKKIPLSKIRPGDLVFFSTDLAEYRAIVHVGLYIGDGKMIEAPYTGANVRIASIHRPSLYGAARP